MHVFDFSTELQNAEVSLTLLKIDSTTDTLPASLKFLRTNKEKTCAGISFWHSLSRWIGKLEFFKRNATKDGVFLDNFPKLS